MIRETRRLTGFALSWALALAIGKRPYFIGTVHLEGGREFDHTDPIVFMQLVKTYKPDIGFCPDGTWRVHVSHPKGTREFITRWSENLEETLAQCIAIIILGNEIEIPDDLPEKAA